MTSLLNYILAFSIFWTVSEAHIEICAYPNGPYCARRTPDNRTVITFQHSVYNTTKFYWPDMGMVKMMHDKVVNFDNIREINFADNCHWIFSWRKALEWRALSLRIIRFEEECEHWARVYGYCVNVPNQWRRRLTVINGQLCHENDVAHRRWIENSGESETADSEEIHRRDGRRVRTVPRHAYSLDENDLQSIVSPPDEYVIEANEKVHYDSIDEEKNPRSLPLTVDSSLAERDRLYREQIRIMQERYEQQLSTLRNQLHACSLRQSECNSNRLSSEVRSDLQDVQYGLADLTAKVAELLARN